MGLKRQTLEVITVRLSSWQLAVVPMPGERKPLQNWGMGPMGFGCDRVVNVISDSNGIL